MQTLARESADKIQPNRQSIDPFNNLNVLQKGLVLIAVPLISGLIAVALLLSLLDSSETQLVHEARVRKIHSLLNTSELRWGDAAVKSGCYAFSKEQKYRDEYNEDVAATKILYGELAELLKSNPEEMNALKPAMEVAEKLTTFGDWLVPEKPIVNGWSHTGELSKMEARLDFHRAIRECNRLTAALSKTIDKCEGVQSLDSSRARKRVRTSVVVFGSFSVVISAFLAALFSRSITNRLKIIMDNALLLASRSPLHERLSGTDEIAKLDQLFHQMSSELVEAGIKARAITDNAVDVICAVDSARRFTEINPACFKSWGYAPDALIGKRLIDIIDSDDVDRTLNEFHCAFSAGARVNFQNRVRRSNGSIAHARWSINWSPERKTYFCIAHDITKMVEIENLKREFVSMVSHDLRTPLTSLQSALALFESGAFGTLNDRGQNTVKRASDNLTRLINMIDGLLDIEKLEAGKMHMNMEVLDLAQIAARSVNAVAYLAETNGIKINCQDTHIDGFGDAAKLIQVVVNLLSNAIKFSPNGSTIEVSYLDTDDYFEMRVSDQGRGIPESHIEKVFSRFEQVDSADHTKKGGKGLGLAICKSIIEGHGGTIGVDSKFGAGSTFWFRIPHPQ